MPFWKSLLLHLYYYGDYPRRWWLRRRAAEARLAPVVVLFYHRVADDRAGSWTTSNANFARQIRWLADHVELVSLKEAQRRICGSNPRPCVSITFDDGYADNCHQAIPLLVKKRIPCTYFVTLRNVLRGEPFEHDLAAGCPAVPNTPDQLRAMADAGIEIGAHAENHVNLGALKDEKQLRRQIADSKGRLEELLERPVRYFAFPFGQYFHLSSRAIEIAREAGYEGVCSAYGGYNLPGDDPFQLQRFHVDDSLIRLKNRVSVDPRLLGIPRFRYVAAGATGQPAAQNV